MDIFNENTRNSLLQYTDKNLWSNPELDNQFQVLLHRVSPSLGYLDYFTYMGKHRRLPTAGDFYQVFTISGTDPGYWQFFNRSKKRKPFEQWVNAAELGTQRGIKLDFYNSKGFQYPKSDTWIMDCYDGVTLVAFKKTIAFDMPAGLPMYMRCYSTTVVISTGKDTETSTNIMQYDRLVYDNQLNLNILRLQYDRWRTLTGLTQVIVNGVLKGSFPTVSSLRVGDVIELTRDPTVYLVESYQYVNLENFYSTLDKKRKVIIHPPKSTSTTPWELRYFDDCDFWLVDENGDGLYFNRNNVANIRQLTHRDYSVAVDHIQFLMNQLPNLSNNANVKIMVVYRKTAWEVDFPWESNRVKYLYRLPDAKIVEALTGVNSTIPEWSAQGLEESATLHLQRSQITDITLDMAANAAGYNAMTKVMSQTPIRATYSAIGDGYDIPESYVESCTVYEYDLNGRFLVKYGLVNQKRVKPRSQNCGLIEFIMGQAGRNLSTVISQQPVTLNVRYGHRVYKCGWSIDKNGPDGKWKDITGTSEYDVYNGVITWNFNTTDMVGMVVYNDKFIGYSFELDHIDKTLQFSITHIWEGGGVALNPPLAQIDIIMNNNTLIPTVDYELKFPDVYIFNREFLNQNGPQKFEVRAHGLKPMSESPQMEAELSFIASGGLGWNDRYNLREDRTTRVVSFGRLFASDALPSAELGNLAAGSNVLNGRPYMVQHHYAPVKFVKEYESYYLYDKGRELDKRVSDYLTEHLPKQTPPAYPSIQDKYRLFSPFFSKLTADIKNRVFTVPALPAGTKEYTRQLIGELLADHIWWLEHDPIVLGYDQRYMVLFPHYQSGRITVTPNEYLFLTQVNEIYMKSRLVLSGYYEVSNV